eukprot:3114809-Rhodomonas_salina.1
MADATSWSGTVVPAVAGVQLAMIWLCSSFHTSAFSPSPAALSLMIFTSAHTSMCSQNAFTV